MALSELELRHIIERGFLPLQCKCVIDSRGDLSVELLDPPTGRNWLQVGFPGLSSTRAVGSPTSLPK